MSSRNNRKSLMDCEEDTVVLQRVARETLTELEGRNITGKKMTVTLRGNIADRQDTYVRDRTIHITFASHEVRPFLELAATDIESGYCKLFSQYGAESVAAFDTPKISISFE